MTAQGCRPQAPRPTAVSSTWIAFNNSDEPAGSFAPRGAHHNSVRRGQPPLETSPRPSVQWPRMPIADLLRTPLIALPLRNVSFGIYSLGSAVSLTGMWMERIAVGWLTWQLTESGFWLGVVAFADFFPVILIAPIAGAAADRWDRLQVVKV